MGKLIGADVVIGSIVPYPVYDKHTILILRMHFNILRGNLPSKNVECVVEH